MRPGPGSSWRGAALALAAAAIPVTALAGFTVDDAWIVARVAARLAAGHGHRFNASDVPVDAVTPLGFAVLLAPAGAGGPLAAFAAARWLGALAWLGAVAGAGWALGALRARPPAPGAPPLGPRAWVPPLVVLAACPTLGAWASAGLETGAVMALGLVAALGGRGAVAAAALAAAWRPELIPWAAALGLARELPRRADPGDAAPGPRDAPHRRRVLVAALAPLGAALLVAAVRALAFGAPLPLAVLAKPSDAGTGLRYLWGALAFTGPPLLALAPFTWKHLSPPERAPLVAAGVHGLALLAVGGDWMPLHRLAAPALPGLLLVAVAVGRRAPAWSTALRTLAGLAGPLAVGLTLGPDSRAVLERRLALVEAARPILAGAHTVAALDVGWVGLATPATVADVAGVTDRRVAALPGGHTSKGLPSGWLERRGTDALVVLLAPGAEVAPAWWQSAAARDVEARLLRQAGADPGWHAARVTAVALPGTDQRYLVARRLPAGTPPSGTR